MKFFIYIFILLSISFNLAFTQYVESDKYRLGESFERTGDYQSASRIYKELFQANNRNKVFFDAVVRTYKALNMYSDLIPIVEIYLKNNKNSEVYSLYGELLWRNGKFNEANNAWEEAVNTDKKEIKTYSDVANSQIVTQQFEKAIQTYKTSRSNIGNPKIFSSELSQLYIVVGDFKNGTIEILNTFEEDNNPAIAQGRLSALMLNQEAIVYIKEMLQKKSSSNNSINYKFIYAWFLREIKDFEQAFKIYKDIDELTNSGGREVLNFANNSSRDGQYSIAIKAYNYIIDKGKDNPYIHNALYGYAKTLEQKFSDSANYTQKDVLSVIDRYRYIIKEFPNSTPAYDGKFRIAVLYFEYLSDSKSAIEELKDLINTNRNKKQVAIALNYLANIYTTNNLVEEAKDCYSKVSKDFAYIAEEETLVAKIGRASCRERV